jgi:cytoskeletal protein CcmA (bactofilin family)
MSIPDVLRSFAAQSASQPRAARTTPPPPPAAEPARETARKGAFQMSSLSVIGSDLMILGQGLKIISRGSLQIDGEVMGDVVGQEVVIGDSAKVTGLVNAEKVVVRGMVNGTIRGLDVMLSSNSNVEGDIHHKSLTIEQGAMFEGKSRRPADVESLRPRLEADDVSAEQQPEPEVVQLRRG